MSNGSQLRSPGRFDNSENLKTLSNFTSRGCTSWLAEQSRPVRGSAGTVDAWQAPRLHCLSFARSGLSLQVSFAAILSFPGQLCLLGKSEESYPLWRQVS